MLAKTGWKYDNSSGQSVSAGAFFEVVGSHLKLYLKSPYAANFVIDAVGAGVGVGQSLLDITAAVGSTVLPSEGSELYSPDGQPLSIADLSSVIMIYTASAAVGAGVSASLAIFLGLDEIEKAAWFLTLFNKSPLQMLSDYFVSKKRASALCFFGGDQAVFNIATDISCAGYDVVNVGWY